MSNAVRIITNRNTCAEGTFNDALHRLCQSLYRPRSSLPRLLLIRQSAQNFYSIESNQSDDDRKWGSDRIRANRIIIACAKYGRRSP